MELEFELKGERYIVNRVRSKRRKIKGAKDLQKKVQMQHLHYQMERL
ncbi:hypothetical protein Q5M85_19990 [Paraclostridium bifermentans]|nr:hypothetical protein [Paraclostridium bifermentans]